MGGAVGGPNTACQRIQSIIKDALANATCGERRIIL